MHARTHTNEQSAYLADLVVSIIGELHEARTDRGGYTHQFLHLDGQVAGDDLQLDKGHLHEQGQRDQQRVRERVVADLKEERR